MWEYSDKVKEHFFQPRNAKAVENANATGDVGSLSCGDALRLTLDVDPETEVIRDAGFQTFGCGSAIASSSALTEIIKGKTLDEALQVSNQEIADYLDGLPPEKMHCSVMGREALEAAIANYRGEVWADDHEEGDLICKCFGIDSAMIERTIEENNLRSMEDITNFTKAGGGCTSCHEAIEEIVDDLNLKRVKAVPQPAAESVEADVPTEQAVDEVSNGNALTMFDQSGLAQTTEPLGGQVAFDPDDVATPEAVSEPVQAGKSLTMLQKVRRIEAVVDEMRPHIERDGGAIELLDFDGSKVHIALSGACTNCQLASATVGGIQQRITEALGEFIRVVPMEKRKPAATA